VHVLKAPTDGYGKSSTVFLKKQCAPSFWTVFQLYDGLSCFLSAMLPFKEKTGLSTVRL